MRNGLHFFTRTSDRRCWNIAAFHSPHSLTWSWILSFSYDGGRIRPHWYGYKDNNGLQWGFRIPLIGFIRWSRQQPMWFRDLYHRREEG